MQTVYKVISKTRYGSNMAGFLLDSFEMTPEKVLKEYPKLKPYFPVYVPGKVITAVKGSPGIFCFKNKESAIEWIRTAFYFPGHSSESVTIIQVIGLGKPMKSRPIISGCFRITNLVAETSSKGFLVNTPRGCITFSRVYVCE